MAVTAVTIEKENEVVNGHTFDDIPSNKVTFGDEAVELVAVNGELSEEEAITDESVNEQVITVEIVKEEAINEANIYKAPVEEQVTIDLIKEEAINESNNEKKESPVEEKKSKEEEKKESKEEKKESLEEKKEFQEENEHNDQVQTTVKRKPTAIRRLNQVEAVVLPGNQQEAIASLSSVNVQFGSLNLNQGSSDSEVEGEVKETVIQQKEQAPASKEVPVATKPAIPQMTKESIPPQAITQAPIVQLQAVAPLPHQPVLQESYTSANYSTFVANTMSAYHHGIIAPTSTADYTVYNTEPQRMVMN